MNVNAKLRVISVGNIGRQLLHSLLQSAAISEQAPSFGFVIAWALLSMVLILAGGLWAFNPKLYARLYSRIAIGDYVARDPEWEQQILTLRADMRVHILLRRHRRNLPPAKDAQTTLAAVAYHFAVLAGGGPAAATTYRTLSHCCQFCDISRRHRPNPASFLSPVRRTDRFLQNACSSPFAGRPGPPGISYR
jgi:hypothetical protein